MSEFKKLSDVFSNAELDALKADWDSASRVSDRTPLPPGEYTCRVLDGSLFRHAKTGNSGYKLSLEIIEGERAGRKCWYDIWLTKPAMHKSKVDLAKLDISQFEQLEKPLPKGIIVVAKIALKLDSKGSQFNYVVSFEVVDIDPVPSDDWTAPDDFNWGTGIQATVGNTKR